MPPGRSLFLARDGLAFRARGSGQGDAFVPVFPPAPGVVGGPPGAAITEGAAAFPPAGGGVRWELVTPAGAVVSAL